MNGKGSGRRPEAKKGAYAEGWERIYGQPVRQPPKENQCESVSISGLKSQSKKVKEHE
jgi:hypothetical protein